MMLSAQNGQRCLVPIKELQAFIDIFQSDEGTPCGDRLVIFGGILHVFLYPFQTLRTHAFSVITDLYGDKGFVLPGSQVYMKGSVRAQQAMEDGVFQDGLEQKFDD